MVTTDVMPLSRSISQGRRPTRYGPPARATPPSSRAAPAQSRPSNRAQASCGESCQAPRFFAAHARNVAGSDGDVGAGAPARSAKGHRLLLLAPSPTIISCVSACARSCRRRARAGGMCQYPGRAAAGRRPPTTSTFWSAHVRPARLRGPRSAWERVGGRAPQPMSTPARCKRHAPSFAEMFVGSPTNAGPTRLQKPSNNQMFVSAMPLARSNICIDP